MLSHPYENMPCYGREVGTAVSEVATLLMMDYDVAGGELDNLLIGFIQVGIDLYGARKAGTTWIGAGGHDNGRKWPIIFAGIMLDVSDMKNISGAFAEDSQTYYGADGIAYWGRDCDSPYFESGCSDSVSGARDCRPKSGVGDGCPGYRDCCTSHTWVGEALAARIMRDSSGKSGKELWNHNAFFDYVDRWINNGGNAGQVFIKNMWDKYRTGIPSTCPGTDTSCGTYPNCQNCNSLDECSGTSYKNYYCSSTTCTYTTTPNDPKCTTTLYGDVSGDSEVTAFDAALAAQIAVGLSNPDIKNAAAAEVSGDSKVTAYDAALIAQRAEGIIPKFPIE